MAVIPFLFLHYIVLTFIFLFSVTFSLYVLQLITYWFFFLYHLFPLSFPFQFLLYLFSGRRNISLHLIFPTHAWIMFTWKIITRLSTRTTLPWWAFFFVFVVVVVFFPLFPQNAALSHLLTLRVYTHLFTHLTSENVSVASLSTIFLNASDNSHIKATHKLILMSPTEDAFCVQLHSCLSCEAYCACIACCMGVERARRIWGERRIKGEAYFWNVGTGEMHGALHVLDVAGLLSFVTKHAWTSLC